jgi:hypothetical protein
LEDLDTKVQRTRKTDLARSRTHNEQTLMFPCGVAIARATFYNAEAVSNVLVRSRFCQTMKQISKLYYNFAGVYQESHVHPRCTEARPHHLRQLLPRKTAGTGRPLVRGYRDVRRPLAPRKQAQEDTRILQGKLQPKGLSGAPDGGWRMVLQHFDCRTTQRLVRRLPLNLQRDGPGKV